MSSDPQLPSIVGSVLSVQVGRVARLGGEGVMSGFVKTPVANRVAVGLLGLDADEQADLRVHGGPDKAVYGYGWSNYAHWRADFPQYETLLVPGGLGENLTLQGCDEERVCLEDVVRIGTALLQVTQPRQPCFKFALRFDDVAMPRAMVRNGYCGWYYRVLAPGFVAAGDSVVLEQRPNPHWSIDRANRLIIQRRASAAERSEFAQLTSRSR